MRRGLETEIQVISLLSLLALIIGLANDFLVYTMLIVFFLYLIWVFINFLKVYRWIEADCKLAPPDVTGISADMANSLYRMQQRNIRTDRRRKNLSDRVGQVTSALPDAIATLSSERVLQWWNPSAIKILGFKNSDKGQSIVNIVRDPRFIAFIEKPDISTQLELKAAHDQSRTVIFSATTFGEGEIILVARDITRLKHLEQMRQDFLANISHELRTPLTVLSGYTETLMDNTKSVPNTWVKALSQIQEQTNRMIYLADDLVMLSQLESTTVPVPKTPIDLEKLLLQVHNDAKIISENIFPGKPNIISLDLEQNIQLTGDQKELYSAFSNLVLNAIKHNPIGTSIDIRAYNADNSVVVEISDDGCGIDSQHISRLTERFYRVDQSRSTETGGTGLGLAIVKHVLIRHSGVLKIKSKVREGTSFQCKFSEKHHLSSKS
ncbi:phosphate regulon sensor histidine kinase PhoR [Porticoccus sp.]|nr:phosphate regulon sensor histidine kinase PhoR [Cellvibrionales bacterium]MDA7737339.1 phosphate regulon sensor histidine kinase PhoR [Porticoccus sp.]MDA7842409.1 phosphate regulon sensor histidine kinase PhoR [Porticoccus sp.]MDC1270220.1 phosphate regulon sensor histidine kinase PhoR [Porticoccus sp.]